MTAWIANPLNPFGRMTRRAFALTLFSFTMPALPALVSLWPGAGVRPLMPQGPGMVLIAMAAFTICLALMQRVRDIGLPGAVALAALVPGAGLLVLVWATVWPGRRGPTRFGIDPRGWVI